MVANKVAMLMRGSPAQTVLTPNSDTPYAGVNVDLTDGPMVFEIPPGALMGVVNDLNQRYVMDLGLPGPDAGKGGKHILLPPGYTGRSLTGITRERPRRTGCSSSCARSRLEATWQLPSTCWRR